jgi:hypothetical protein
MSFLKSLFGSNTKEKAAPAPAREIEHAGFLIQATPFKEGGQFQTCGIVAKDIGGIRKEHRFIRADRFATVDEAVDFSLSKARQIIDEQGDRLFG